MGIKVTFQGQESHFKRSGTADMRKQFWFVGLKMLPVVLSGGRQEQEILTRCGAQ